MKSIRTDPRNHAAEGERRKVRVYCTQFASCRWAGYRMAETHGEAREKPCPRCGKEVTS